MATLYQLTQNYSNIAELMENEEVPKDILEDALAQISDDIGIKTENIVKFIKNLESDILARKNEIERLTKANRSDANKIDNLKSILFNGISLLEGKKIKTSIFTLSIRKGAPSVNIIDINSIPKECMRIIEEPNKTMIKEIIKNGNSVPGAELISKETLQIK